MREGRILKSRGNLKAPLPGSHRVKAMAMYAKRKSTFKQFKSVTLDNSRDFMTKIGLNNTIEKLVCNLFSVKLTYMRNGLLERKRNILTLTYR